MLIISDPLVTRMIDTDLYLLPTIAHYFLDMPQGHGRADAFLSRTASLNNSNLNMSYRALLSRNAAYILERAIPFTRSPRAANLLHLRPGQPVGNWRDSNQGIGYGQIPFDVNVALVPAALRGLERLVQSGLLTLENQPDAGVQAGRYADIWEAHAAGLFDVKVKAATAESRWEDFVVRANLSEALLDSQGGGHANASDVTFYALSLHDDGTPVDVNDHFLSPARCDSLSIGLGDAQRPWLWSVVYFKHIQPSITACRRTPSTLSQRLFTGQLSTFPSADLENQGLLTNIGMLTANPALSSNRTQIDVLNRDA